MATLVLSAVGASIGGGFGGAFLGLSGAVIGRAVGATIGRAIDQRLLGGGSKAVETGRIDRLRLQTAGEGMPIAQLWGQMRLPGHVIWASPLEEIRQTQGRGKGASKTKVTEISYRLSVAMALCEGRILGVGRIWADGEEIAAEDLNMQVYLGGEAQMPDGTISAFEGDDAPAYRGIAYVVMEDLHLERWGNRMPQFSFEVTRAAQDGSGLAGDVTAVAMIPGTGEYALATTPVTRADDGSGQQMVNMTTPAGGTDFSVSLRTMKRELPKVGSVSLVVSWFGDDLRIGECSVQPKVEQLAFAGYDMAWNAGGIGRAEAGEVTRVAGKSIYGGTPSDRSVIEALTAIDRAGCKAVFYPFILMEQIAGNGLADPYGREEQAVMPWRGRITTRIAPGRDGSSDGTAAAKAEVDAFFGAAEASDFSVSDGAITYTGPNEWSYRRFILHYAHLCAMAGGVDAFLIGSEMIGMTQIRGAGRSYPAVDQLRQLAADVRAILGPDVKLSYASDWSEYFGHQPGGGEVMFHLDPLWADENIDFIGIDNYMPLSDWRDGATHLDAGWRRIDNHQYLLANVAGGEGYDWYYASDQDRDDQHRTPIVDGAHGEDWIWRYKDLKNWWRNPHFNRPNGIRSSEATAWVPGSKPVWFTEIGCAALDKGTNQPNKFLDAMSSESRLPHYSNGRRDDAIQAAYVRAVMAYWSDPANNPAMPGGGRMVDASRAHVWCWDARPYPAFPQRMDLWSDGPAWERGHWLNGRAGAVPLAGVVGDICRDAGVPHFDTSGLSGVVRGYASEGDKSGRALLQPLMLAHGFDAVERDGALRFVMRDGLPVADLGPEHLAMTGEIECFQTVRAPEPELAGRVRLTHIEAGADYTACTAETILPGDDQSNVSDNEFPMALTRAEGRAIAERWLAESRVSRDAARFALPPSQAHLGAGDVVRMQKDGRSHLWRIDRLERAGALTIDAVRVEPGTYLPALSVEVSSSIKAYRAPLPVNPVVLDLPLMRGDEVPHAPYLAVSAKPWPGQVAAFLSAEAQGGFELNQIIRHPAMIGVTESPLAAARPGVPDRGAPLRLRLQGGQLGPVGQLALLNGANLLAIGDGSSDRWELLQFADAAPIGQGVWEVSNRLRGQAGTDALIPAVWPVGSTVVIIDRGLTQLDLPPVARGQERFWHIGPAERPMDDRTYRSGSFTLRGIGLRPYAPCHLRCDGRRASWVRRTRIGGDGWDGPDVPLSENREQYLLRLRRGSTVLYEIRTDAPAHEIPSAVWQQALAQGAFHIEVAQLSDQFGAGPFVRREING